MCVFVFVCIIDVELSRCTEKKEAVSTTCHLTAASNPKKKKKKKRRQCKHKVSKAEQDQGGHCTWELFVSASSGVVALADGVLPVTVLSMIASPAATTPALKSTCVRMSQPRKACVGHKKKPNRKNWSTSEQTCFLEREKRRETKNEGW